MGDAYAKVSENREQAALREKILILADHCFIVPRTHVIERMKYMFTIMPKTKEAGDSIGWEGTITAIKQNVTDARTTITANFQRKLKDLQHEIKRSSSGFV